MSYVFEISFDGGKTWERVPGVIADSKTEAQQMQSEMEKANPSCMVRYK